LAQNVQLKLNNPEQSWANGENFMPDTNNDIVLTTKEAIQYLKISKPTFLKYIHLGKIKAVKAGAGWRVHKSELYRFLNVQER
jgi:excisionase family DNA binding protein